jgi:crossover junction endodeoxyribonuclease RuvC
MILGIDPGTATVGFAFVEGKKKLPLIRDYGVLTTPPLKRESMPQRLLELGEDMEKLIQKYKPTKAVVEDLFFFKNAKTVITVAQSRGMLIYILTKNGVEVTSKTPLQVKQTLCGYGRADKKQVQEMVKKIYKLDKIPKPDDAADALALAWFGLN